MYYYEFFVFKFKLNEIFKLDSIKYVNEIRKKLIYYKSIGSIENYDALLLPSDASLNFCISIFASCNNRL